MNTEKIDNLESYLKNELPKIEPTIPITNFGSVDLENLMDSIKQFKKVPTFDELLRENKRLREQLEEKDKIIDEILNHPFFTNECPYSSIGDGFVQELCDCDNCQEDYKKCWIKYFKNEILERGKNGK